MTDPGMVGTCRDWSSDRGIFHNCSFLLLRINPRWSRGPIYVRCVFIITDKVKSGVRKEKLLLIDKSRVKGNTYIWVSV